VLTFKFYRTEYNHAPKKIIIASAPGRASKSNTLACYLQT
jgi:hypothetical protein